MTDLDLRLTVGGTSRQELRARLDAAGVALNPHAETLLEDPVVAGASEETIALVGRSVAELGLPDGGTLSQVIAAVQEQGLALCPPCTAPFLRLALPEQAQAPDSVLSAGRVPTGALTVLSAPLREDHEHPKGFYLRVVDGVRWLRGFRCDDEYVWPPQSTLVLRAPQEG